MGVSTDAIIYWGFDFCEGYDEESFPFFREEYDYDWEKYWLEQNGYEEPDVDWGAYDRDNPDDWPDREKWNEWYEIKREALEECHCEVSAHCSDEYPIHYVTVSQSQMTAWRGYPKDLTELISRADEIDYEEWQKLLRNFCKTMNIKWQEPSWYLASYWG